VLCLANGSGVSAGQSSARAFGGVLAIIAVIGGLASIFLPMQNQIAHLQNEVKQLNVECDYINKNCLTKDEGKEMVSSINSRFESHTSSYGHEMTMEKLLSLCQRVSRVEERVDYLGCSD
jgi:hypothetical protein